MSDMLQDPMVLRQIIMDHYEYPRNHQLVEDQNYHSKHMASESCIDDITVQALFDGETIKDIRFDGVACTIATASTSIMTELLKNKTKKEGKKIIDEYFKMIDQQSFDDNVLEEAIAFRSVGQQPNRIKCATIGWNAIAELITESE